MTDQITFHGPQFAPDYTPEIIALAALIQRNGGSIPEHERPRALELASRIDEQASADTRMLDKLSFADRYEYPALRGYMSPEEARDRLK